MRLAAVVMAGGSALRMGGVVKPLLPVCGVPMIVRVLSALSPIADSVVVATSPSTTPFLKGVCSLLRPDSCIELAGSSYPADMRLASLIITKRPLLFVPADTPLLTSGVLEGFVKASLRMGKGLVTLLGRSGPVGISILLDHFNPWSNITLSDDSSLFNVNTWSDYVRANRLCSMQRS
ncbi:MAG: hypothetical protein DSY37_02490 [Hyperthermus sp.]|nr:MAG: hypothetical protein DSY37_02490 [Hyperthermus sp.]